MLINRKMTRISVPFYYDRRKRRGMYAEKGVLYDWTEHAVSACGSLEISAKADTECDSVCHCKGGGKLRFALFSKVDPGCIAWQALD